MTIQDFLNAIGNVNKDTPIKLCLGDDSINAEYAMYKNGNLTIGADFVGEDSIRQFCKDLLDIIEGDEKYGQDYVFNELVSIITTHATGDENA